MTHDLDRCLAVATEAARAAGRLLQESRARFTVREKGRADLVTDVDDAAQARIRDILHAAFPDHAFLGEESTAEAQALGKSTTGPLWIVDPLDGTVNYVHGFPMYAVSIALAVGVEVQVGVVYDPSGDELYQASRHGPATCNGRSLRTTSVDCLAESLLALGFSTKPEEQDWLQGLWRQFSLASHGIRRTGSAALNLAHVAAGRFDAFCASGVHSWDVAAGILLVEAAGGRVTDLQGTPYDLHGHRRILATNGPLHLSMMRKLDEAGNPC